MDLPFGRGTRSPATNNRDDDSKHLPKSRVAIKDSTSFFEFYNRDMVLHFQPCALLNLEHESYSMINACMINACTGVYVPMEGKVSLGRPVYKMDIVKTQQMINRLHSSQHVAQQLFENGIAIHWKEKYVSCNSFFLSYRVNLWFVTCGLTWENSQTLVRCPALVSDEAYFHNDPDALWILPDLAFSEWYCLGETFFGSVVPATTFRRSVELAASSHNQIQQVVPKAIDFWLWNRPLVLHSNNETPSNYLNSYMGVYVPLQNDFFHGHPVWIFDKGMTRTLCKSISSDGAVKQDLMKRGIRLELPNESFKNRPCMFMMSQTLFATDSFTTFKDNPKQRKLRNCEIPAHETRLMTEPDALVSLGKQAFASWELFEEESPSSTSSSSIEVRVATTPLKYFEYTIKLSEIELSLAEGNEVIESKGRNEASKASSKKRKKSRKKKRKTKKNGPAEAEPNATITGDTLSTARDNENEELDALLDGKSIPMEEKVDKVRTEELSREEVSNDKKNKEKKKKKKKKISSKNKEVTESEVGTDAVVPTNIAENMNFVDQTVPKVEQKPKSLKEKEDRMVNNVLSIADQCKRLLLGFGVDISSISGSSDSEEVEDFGFVCTTPDSLVRHVFGPSSEKPPWLSIDESVTSLLFSKLLQQGGVTDTMQIETLEWLQLQADKIFTLAYSHKRSKDMKELLHAKIPITTEVLIEVFDNMPKGGGHEFSNKLTSSIKAIRLDKKGDFRSILNAASEKVSKKARKSLVASLKKARFELEKEGKMKKKSKPSVSVFQEVTLEHTKPPSHSATTPTAIKQKSLEEFNSRIDSKLEWYSDMLEIESSKASMKHESREESDEEDDLLPIDDKQRLSEHCKEDERGRTTGTSVQKLSAEQIATTLEKCADLSPTQQIDVINNVEMKIDLFESEESLWTIDITEQAHKWFRKRSKRHHKLCERVIRRLKVLSFGRWSYVLCKPLTMKKVATKLYETKIDTARRIIWEVAVSFSPRRSSEHKNYCEQVIRVWDIVEDHDNLQRAIELTVNRIEKSHTRGQQCIIYSELSDSDTIAINKVSMKASVPKMFVPRVFSMNQSYQYRDEAKSLTSAQIKPAIKHFPPANDDDQQFNLLKFYELNVSAIKLILNSKDENADLPFTPGPKEHEIIHFRSQPPSSLLLMGRSGTGKTTCLVFRMWAQYMAYCDNDKDIQPRQLFVTKNGVLRNEVEKSFKNMGLAWRRTGNKTTVNSMPPAYKVNPLSDDSTPGYQQSVSTATEFPMFLSSDEWLDIIDQELPGKRFFTPNEADRRVYRRKEDDTVERGMEEFFARDATTSAVVTEDSVRKEMTFSTFCSLWRKINSRIKACVDPSLVWLEIKSFIKGSVAALHIGASGRDEPSKRFLSKEEYLRLPRKQSRLDGQQREVVYDLYLSYEKLKKDRNHYDEMDLVYNLAGRIRLLTSTDACKLLPIDTVFIDEVQDFTQGELYLLTKLCRDPNNLMLAGDTAQSIAVGVGFRFTDVRQIFYNSFGGKEPKLLQLTHNYRSHSGVLRLAASVVELLYFFFSDSLDKLPPDLGLFPGPKPVIMEVKAVADLVLMLDGSKRETSRIEFGAHQVVIVRNEKAKESLPEEFSVDRDWVMTVQEAKGLEFDDVLLYNFFSDSEAEDLWRVVSNYTREDIEAYFAEPSASLTGIQKYDWDDIDTQIRPMGFDKDKHKILETEFKMLYTAITRARVNVFIAEEDSNLSRPMFNYFKSRRLVDVVGNATRDGNSELQAFGGKLNTSEEWQARGEYYLQNAEGQRQVGCLRLAANCFEKSGDGKKRDHARAYLAFVEIEEQGSSSRRRAKQSSEHRERLLGIAAQLLETEEFGFLNKASWCLLQTGDQEFLRCAKMFEMYALTCYYQRMQKKINDISPTPHEQQYFSYAAKLFMKCLSRRDLTQGEKVDIILSAFKNFLSSATVSDLQEASVLIETQSEHCQKIFTQIFHVYKGGSKSTLGPLMHFRDKLEKQDDEVDSIRRSLIKLSRIACRSCYAAKDTNGFSTAFEVLLSRADRLQVLSSLECNPDEFISNTCWAYHPCFLGSSSEETKRKIKKDDSDCISIKVTDLLIKDLGANEDKAKISDVLEERGRLLEAAEWLEKSEASQSEKIMEANHLKALELKARYVELLLSCSWTTKKSEVQSLLQLLLESVEKSKDVVPTNVKYSILMSNLKVNGETKLWEAIECCGDSLICRHEGLLAATRAQDLCIPFLMGKDMWNKLYLFISTSYEVKRAGEALARPLFGRTTNEEMSLISQVESYFELTPYHLDPNQLSTKVVTNMRLRIAIESEGEKLPVATSLPSKSLVIAVDREKIDTILAKHICRSSVVLMEKLQEYILNQIKKSRPCLYLRTGGNCKCSTSHGTTRQLQYLFFDFSQLHILCLRAIRELCATIESICRPDLKLSWTNKKAKADEQMKKVIEDLMAHLIYSNHIQFVKDSDRETYERSDAFTISLRTSVLEVLEEYAHKQWYSLKAYSKKSDLLKTIQYWRALRFCCDNDDCSVKVQDKLAKVEQNVWQLQNDWDKNKRDHFIKNKSKVSNGKVVAASIVPRMWFWALDSVTDDLFNSIQVVHRIIRDTTTRPGLTTLPKHEQVVLLEANAVGLFAALSFRYSEASNSGKNWIVIPKRSYLDCLLLGKGEQGGRGLGVALKDTLENTCHKHFFDAFEKCVRYLECMAGLIESSGLLSLREKKTPLEHERFERAFVLTVFILTNAVSVFRIGVDMHRSDAKDDLQSLPKLPLCGAIRSLVKCLRKVIEQDYQRSQFLQEIKSTSSLSSIEELLEATNETLQISRYDAFILCRVHQNDQGVQVETRKEFADFSKNRLDIYLSEEGDVFVKQGRKCESFLPQRRIESDVTVEYQSQDSELSKKSDEMNAAISIQRFVRHRKQRKTGGEGWKQYHFRRWKQVLRSFTRMAVRIFKEEKNRRTPVNKSWREVLDGTQTGDVHRLTNIENMWDNQSYMISMQRKWDKYLSMNFPICDFIECGFCCLVFEPVLREQRHCLWQQKFSVLPYITAVRHMGIPVETPCFHQHCMECLHRNAHEGYINHVNELSGILASLEASRLMLGELSGLSDKGSWYLNMADQAKYLLCEIDYTQTRLLQEATSWPLPSEIGIIMNQALMLLQRSHGFYLERAAEEPREDNEILQDKADDDFDDASIADDFIVAFRR